MILILHIKFSAFILLWYSGEKKQNKQQQTKAQLYQAPTEDCGNLAL